MKRLVLGAATLALLSGIAMAAPAEAATLTHSERAAIAHAHRHLNVLKVRVRADGHVSLWERMRVRAAEAHLKALAYKYRHN
jgi:CHASE1-domain containing sensor protein